MQKMCIFTQTLVYDSVHFDDQILLDIRFLFEEMKKQLGSYRLQFHIPETRKKQNLVGKCILDIG